MFIKCLEHFKTIATSRSKHHAVHTLERHVLHHRIGMLHPCQFIQDLGRKSGHDSLRAGLLNRCRPFQEKRGGRWSDNE